MPLANNDEISGDKTIVTVVTSKSTEVAESIPHNDNVDELKIADVTFKSDDFIDEMNTIIPETHPFRDMNFEVPTVIYTDIDDATEIIENVAFMSNKYIDGDRDDDLEHLRKESIKMFGEVTHSIDEKEISIVKDHHETTATSKIEEATTVKTETVISSVVNQQAAEIETSSIRATTEKDEDEDEDYVTEDTDDNLKASCIALLCAGK